MGRGQPPEGGCVKALSRMESRTEKRAAGATKLSEADIKGKLVEFSFWLSKQGYDEDTVKLRTWMMKRLTKLGTDLRDPEDVKKTLAEQKFSNGYKMLLCYAYENFLKMEGLSWERPRYKQEETLPFIPTEAELDQLIAATSKRVGTFLQGLKDTGADPGELAKVKWIDINKQSRTINIKPVKGHSPRIMTVSREFIDRLERLPKTSETVFNLRGIRAVFQRQRKKIAWKLNNPRLLEISFRTFRHWKGTMEYHRTRDPYHVKKFLGHKSLKSTERYINLENAIFKTLNEEFTVKVAQNVQEACSLIEVGFEYITGEYNDGGKIFRKRK